MSDTHRLGRDRTLIQRILENVQIWRQDHEVPLRISVDQARLQAYLLTLAQEIEQQPRDATVQVVAGQIVPTPSRSGRRLLVATTLTEVNTALLTLEPQTVTLRTRRLSPAVPDVADVEWQIRRLLAKPLMLSVGERRWQWDAATLGGLITFLREPHADGAGERAALRR